MPTEKVNAIIDKFYCNKSYIWFGQLKIKCNVRENAKNLKLKSKKFLKFEEI